jgi:hypothetical protein
MKLRWLFAGFTIFIAGLLAGMLVMRATPATVDAQEGRPTLAGWQIVDLTQPLNLNIPIWPGDPAFEIEAWASYETDGYFINRIAIGEHSGTHWERPKHSSKEPAAPGSSARQNWSHLLS